MSYARGGAPGNAHSAAATFLCSPYAAYLTGHDFVLDGAERLRRGIRMPEFVPIRDCLPARAPR